MSRIVIDAREISSSTGRYIGKLIEYLQLIDNNNEYYIMLNKKEFTELNFTSKSFNKILVKELKFSLSEQITMPFTTRRLNPDLVHFTLNNQPALLGLNRVTTIHDLTPIRFAGANSGGYLRRLKRVFFIWLTRRVIKKSKKIITPTKYVKGDITEYSGADDSKVVVTPESADKIPQEPAQLDGLVNEKFIFYAGRAHPHKNLPQLIKAFEILHASHSELKLVLVGKTEQYYTELQTITQKSPASKNIVFTGFVGDAQLKWLYENAEAYVFPSLSEGFGLPGLEAMVHGCPVVSSNATCLPEVYGDAVIYFDPNNAQQMADKIQEVLNNPELKANMVKLGYTQAAKYSWRRMAEQTLEVYNSVIK